MESLWQQILRFRNAIKNKDHNKLKESCDEIESNCIRLMEKYDDKDIKESLVNIHYHTLRALGLLGETKSRVNGKTDWETAKQVYAQFEKNIIRISSFLRIRFTNFAPRLQHLDKLLKTLESQITLGSKRDVYSSCRSISFICNELLKLTKFRTIKKEVKEIRICAKRIARHARKSNYISIKAEIDKEYRKIINILSDIPARFRSEFRECV